MLKALDRYAVVSNTTLLLVLAPLLWLVYRYFKGTFPSTSVNGPPPGPPPKFLVGNTLDIPLRYRAEEFMRWGKRYNSGILSD